MVHGSARRATRRSLADVAFRFTNTTDSRKKYPQAEVQSQLLGSNCLKSTPCSRSQNRNRDRIRVSAPEHFEILFALFFCVQWSPKNTQIINHNRWGWGLKVKRGGMYNDGGCSSAVNQFPGCGRELNRPTADGQPPSLYVPSLLTLSS